MFPQDLGDALRATEDASDWLIGGNGRSNSHVVLHDRLMTDALLGNAPIKAEHSYCTTHGSRESLDAIGESRLSRRRCRRRNFARFAVILRELGVWRAFFARIARAALNESSYCFRKYIIHKIIHKTIQNNDKYTTKRGGNSLVEILTPPPMASS